MYKTRYILSFCHQSKLFPFNLIRISFANKSNKYAYGILFESYVMAENQNNNKQTKSSITAVYVCGVICRPRIIWISMASKALDISRLYTSTKFVLVVVDLLMFLNIVVVVLVVVGAFPFCSQKYAYNINPIHTKRTAHTHTHKHIQRAPHSIRLYHISLYCSCVAGISTFFSLFLHIQNECGKATVLCSFSMK